MIRRECQKFVQVDIKTHALITQRRQNNCSLDSVEHNFPQFFENSFQHRLLTDLCK